MENRKRLNLDAILNVSAELAEEKGLENVTLNQVADRLGIKSPSLYNHVSGISELSKDLAKLAIQRLEEAIRDAAVGRSKTQALKEIAIAYRKFAKENPELYKAILRLPACEDEKLKESAHAVVRIIYQVMEPYHYSEEDTIHFVRAFRSALHGFISLEDAGFFKSAIDVDESYSRLINGFIKFLDLQEATSC